MNATPMTPPTATTVQGTSSARKGDPAAADTPFSQILSGEIALQVAGAREPHGGKALADRLAELLDRPADPLAATDPSLAMQPPPEAIIAPPTAETLAALGLPFTPSTGPITPPSSEAQGDDAPSPAPLAQHARPTDATLRATTAPGATAAPAPGMDAADASVPAHDGEDFGGLFAARLATDGARTGETPPELISPAALRPAVPPGAADTGPAPTQAATPRLAPEVGNSAWGQALGERIVWMAAGKQQSASLTLNPPNLGPLHIVLNVSSDQATANFFAAQPEVRQAIEAALPKLREMMGEAGIQLGQANVSADTPSQNQASAQDSSRPAPHSGEVTQAAETATAMPAPRMGHGLVDTFA